MEPVAFVSYAHLDDANSAKELSLFHDKLQSELRIQTGLPVHIFFDKKSIGWGKRWAEFIDHNLESAAFLIPILTPAFFQSRACRDEYMKFAQSEKATGRRDLILPIYFVKCLELDLKSGVDSLVDDILSRQYRGWRGLRHTSADSMELLREFAELAAAIADTFFEIQEASKLSPKLKAEQVDRTHQARSEKLS
jgi:cobaltochelatase CobT